MTTVQENLNPAAKLTLVSFVERASIAFTLAAFAWLIVLHGTMIMTEAPMEMRDGAMISTTTALLAGHNPYAFPGVLETGNA